MRLATFDGQEIRPTPDRVREAIFSIIASRLSGFSGTRVLDLYAGTGAMAIEALSRGAEKACLVDSGAQATRLIASNLKACRLEGRAELRREAVLTALNKLSACGPFQLIFLDPPYHRDLVPQTLQALENARLLADGGLIVAEAAADDVIPGVVGSLRRNLERHYGSVAVHLFTHHPDEARR